MQKELYEYCNSDVDILQRGCLELRKQFLEIANIDPFDISPLLVFVWLYIDPDIY